MEEKKIEIVMLGRILHLVESGKQKPKRHNWLVTVCVWAVLGVGTYLLSSRFGSTATGQGLFVLGAFIAGGVVVYAVFNAWQISLWSHASRYLDVESIRKRMSELQ